MLQKKDYTTTTPTKTNVTKQEIPTTTIKKPIVENQTSGKIKTNVTKEGLPTTQQRYQQHQQKLMLQKKDTNNNTNKDTSNTNKN